MADTSAIRAGRAFVELFVDNSKLVRGLRAAEKKVVKFGQNIQAIGRQLFTLGAAVGGVLAVAAKGFASYGDSLSKMSDRTGVSARALSELAYAAQQSGTNIETLEASLRTMQKNLTAAFGGNDAAIQTLESLGINVAKLKAMTPEEQFLTLGEAISRVADPTLRTAFAMRVFGKSGSQLLPMLANGVSGINALRQRCRELGLSVSDLDAANATRLSDALTDLWLTVKAVGFAVGASLAKPLTDLTEQMVTCIAGAAKWINMNRDLVVTAAKVTAAVTGIGVALFVTGLGFVGLGKTIGIVATAIASVAKVTLGGLGLLSGVLKAVAFAAGSVVSVFSGLATAIGVVFSGIVSTIGLVFGTTFSVLATIGTAVFSAIGTAIAAALSPIGLTILALGTVAGACYLVYRNADAIGNAISTAFSAVTNTIGNAVTAVYRFLAGFTEFRVLFGTIGIVTAAIKMLGRAVFWVAKSLIKPTFSTISGIFLHLGKIVVKLAVSITSVLFSCFRQIFGIAKTVFAAVGSIVVSSFYKTVSATKSILSGIGSLIGHALAPVLGIVGATIRGIVMVISTLGGVLRTVAGWIVTFARSFFVVESAVQVFSRVGNAVSAVVGLFARATGTIASTLFSAFQKIPAVVSGTISVLAAVPGTVLAVFQKIPAIISAAFSTTVAVVRGTIGGISSAFFGLVSFMSGIWDGLVTVFSAVFTNLGNIISGSGEFFFGAVSSIGSAVGWLQQQFCNLCSFASESFGAIAVALGRGDIEAAIQVIWATIKLIWIKGSTSLLSTWYWVVDTLQMAWANCVFKISELLTTAWYGVQSIWTDSVYTMQVAWINFMNGIVQAWDYVSTAIAQGIGWIMAKIMGLDPNEMAATITEDYNNRTKQRQDSGRSSIDALAQERNKKIAALEQEKQGTLDILKQDFENATGVRNAAYDAKLAAQEQELEAAKSAYDEAINRARNSDLPQFRESQSLEGEQLSWADSLRLKVEEAIGSFKPMADLESRISVTGSFSAAAISSMGATSTMDRVAKATEQSEKHLAKIADKEEKTMSTTTPKKETQVEPDDKDPAVAELKLQTRLLRDLSTKGGAVFV